MAYERIGADSVTGALPPLVEGWLSNTWATGKGFMSAAGNLSSLTDPAVARTNLGLGNASLADFTVDTSVGTRVLVEVDGLSHVLASDTGWRSIPGSLGERFAVYVNPDPDPEDPEDPEDPGDPGNAHAAIRRVGNTVTFFANLVTTGPVVPGDVLATVPEGFRLGFTDDAPAVPWAQGNVEEPSGIVFVRSHDESGDIRISSPLSDDTRLSGTLTWLTAEEWPDSLPGTALGGG